MTTLPAAVFNLLCTGTTLLGNPAAAEKNIQFEYTESFRIDLNSMRYCTASCISTVPLIDVTPDEIIFESNQQDYSDVIAYVNRESGKYYRRYRAGDMVKSSFIIVSLDRGTCKRMPFSGFPNRKF